MGVEAFFWEQLGAVGGRWTGTLEAERGTADLGLLQDRAAGARAAAVIMTIWCSSEMLRMGTTLCIVC